ncbi:MAG: exodeoxyribonuclease VII large subunit [Verrucomicrobiae bacterium]|nr:exodeoxyribonuclease VII large subunit [Verrucomicrobiae bacterium]
MDLFEFAGAASPEPSRPATEREASTRKPPSKKAVRAELKVFSISQVTRKIRFLLEASLGQVWVAGEVSNVRHQASGHTYFTLKDSDAQLSCVLFKGDARFVKLEIQNGMQLKAFGEITVYEARGQYQMIVKKLEQEGRGTLQARFEELKQRLHAEGLFASEKKKPIPPFPLTLAIVTSPTGAAVRDVLNVLERRAPWVKVIIAPVPVQGADAHAHIVHALELLSQQSGVSLPNLDTIIVCRGGGSIEDLWNFNEESVARAIYTCPIPVISAVGHEIDFTISDFVADLRAPTPSAAAELAVPNGESLARQLTDRRTALNSLVQRRLEQLRRQLDWHARGTLLREPERLIRERSMQLDSLAESLDRAAKYQIGQAKSRIAEARHALIQARPDRVLERRAMRLAALADRLDAAVTIQLKERKQMVATSTQLLKSLGPQSVFNRGFSLTTSEAGKPLSSTKAAPKGTVILTRLADGTLRSEVT